LNTSKGLWVAVVVAVPSLAACGGEGDAEQSAGPKLVASSPDQACLKLKTNFQLQGATVDSAAYVAADFVPPGLAAPVGQPFCRLQLTSKPSADSDIKSEIWMPTLASWNGRFLAVGGGGNSGSIQYAAMSSGLTNGYATLSTDNGHVGGGQEWAIGHPEKVIDFGHRAQAVTAVAGKALTQAFYEEPARKSYWLGCSQGGGKGMMQSQRYPENFDGIVAGAPVFDWVGSQFAAPWVALKGMRDVTQFVPRAKLAAIHTAVLAACDGHDGLADGLIQQPQRCNFNPAVMACPAGTDSNTCLTPGQVTAMQRYYSPVTRPDGSQIYAAFAPGSEGNSVWLGASAPNGNWSGFWPNIVYENPAYSIVASLNVDTDVDYNFAKTKLGANYDAVSTDLDKFKARNGKLLIWHGYNDSSVTPHHTRDYVEAVTTRYGTSQSAEFLRAYFAPGVNHCGGGEGPEPDQMNLLATMVEWVEKGVAPTSVMASHRMGGVVDRTMPLCPYPQVARYKGSGDVRQGTNFVCGAP
jgi:feruloyl esterase